MSALQGTNAAVVDPPLPETVSRPGDDTVFMDSHEPPRMGVSSAFDDLLDFWFRNEPGRVVRNVLEEMEAVIVGLDLWIERLLNQILHDEKFQQLEASWRGLRYLVEQMPVPEDDQDRNHPPVKILMMSATWPELTDDLLNANEFDRSCLFKQVYTNHYGTAGGEPIGLLLGNYEVEPTPLNCRVLGAISQVAAAAFCPFVAGGSPSFWQAESFVELRNPKLVEKASLHPHRIPKDVWNHFREAEDTRFVSLAVPRVVLRAPHGAAQYRNSLGKRQVLRFQEDVSDPELKGYLWGTAAWAMGEVAIREFLQTRWFGEMTGVEPAILDDTPESETIPGRGLVAGLPILSYGTDRPGLQPKPATDLFIDEHLNELFVEQGFLTLARCPGSPYSAFYSAPSLQKPKQYTTQAANANAVLSTTLDSMLCVSRFSHYLKRNSREWLGRFASAEEFEDALQSWLIQYVGDNVSPDASRAERANFPLTAAKVQVLPDPEKYGAYKCQLHLCPRLSPDGLIASIRLMTEFVSDATAEASDTI